MDDVVLVLLFLGFSLQEAGTQAFELDNNNDKDVNAKRNHRREETCGDDIDDSNDDDENDGWWLEVDFILSALSEFSW